MDSEQFEKIMSYIHAGKEAGASLKHGALCGLSQQINNDVATFLTIICSRIYRYAAWSWLHVLSRD